jgi:hypothetical protein
MSKCAKLDTSLLALSDALPGGGEPYAALIGLSYRQALAAMKLAWHPKLATPWHAPHRRLLTAG